MALAPALVKHKNKTFWGDFETVCTVYRCQSYLLRQISKDW